MDHREKLVTALLSLSTASNEYAKTLLTKNVFYHPERREELIVHMVGVMRLAGIGDYEIDTEKWLEERKG